MNNHLWEQANELALRHYNIEVEVDTLSTGETVYVAKNPELTGCMAQGDSTGEAIANLIEARIDYIYTLLEIGLNVPEPAPSQTETTGTETAGAGFGSIILGEPSFFLSYNAGTALVQSETGNTEPGEGDDAFGISMGGSLIYHH